MSSDLKKISIGKINLLPESNQCVHCGYIFAQRSTLNRHLKKASCQKSKNLAPNSDLVKQVKILQKEVAELKNKPSNINQILQVVCVGQKDNYLDMLTEKWGDFSKALEYIKDCALSSIAGDCKLIEKIYSGTVNEDNALINVMRYIDKGRTKIEYYNENKEKVVDNKELFGRKLANNLQNSYLKGINYLITKNLENRQCPNKFLEEYDIQTWNQHIYNLSDLKYHRKIINQLDIPSN